MTRRAGEGEIDSARLGELLRSEVPLFNALKEQDLAQLLPYFRGCRLGEGQELWHEGDISDQLGYLLSGRLQLKKDTEFKDKPVVVGVLSGGALAGELSFLEEGRRPLTAAALEDCQLALFSRRDYLRLEETRPDLALLLVKNILLAVSLRLQKSYERLAAIF